MFYGWCCGVLNFIVAFNFNNNNIYAHLKTNRLYLKDIMSGLLKKNTFKCLKFIILKLLAILILLMIF